MSGIVYVVTNDLLRKHNIYKIGYTGNLQERLRKLNTASPYNFYAVFQYETSDCRRMEKLVHSKLRGQRLNREFFVLKSMHLYIIRCCFRISRPTVRHVA